VSHHRLLSVEEARDTLVSRVQRLSENPEQQGHEIVDLLAAPGRVTSEPVYARADSPPFDRAAVDGYAFRFEDLVAGAGRLRVTGDVPAGAEPGTGPGPGEAWQVATGARLPPGVDTVVRLEDAVVEGEYVHVNMPMRPGDNVARQGEDFRTGSLLLPAGTVLRARHVGMLVAAGHAGVAVVRRPRIAVVSTGSEVVNPGLPRGPAQVWNATAYGVAAAVAEAGGVPVLYGPYPDSPERIATAIQDAAGGHVCGSGGDPHVAAPSATTPDLILTIGGASVGERDLTRRAVAALGGKELFWGVAMKPGTAMFASMLGDLLLVGLSGYPAASLTQFDVLVRPVLARLLGMTWQPRVVRAELTASVEKANRLRRYYRVTLQYTDGHWQATLLVGQKAGVLSGVAQGNGLVAVREGEGPFSAGQEVEAWLLPYGGDPLVL